jgi:hypothetical protein
MDFARIAGAAVLALALWLPPVTARADTSGGAAPAPLTAAVDTVAADATAAADATLPIPRVMKPTVSPYRVAAIAVGTVAGALVGNLMTNGLMTPILTGGLAGPGLAAAGSSAYAVGALTTAFFAGIGAYIGVWASEAPSTPQN